MAAEPVFDVSIVGAGAAGIAASIEAAALGLQTVLLERERPGGSMNCLARVESEPGHPVGLSGAEFTRRAIEQAVRSGVVIQMDEAVAVRHRGDHFIIDRASGTGVRARSIVVATGADQRIPAIPGIEPLFGVGVYTQLPDRLPPSLEGRTVVVAGSWGKEIERVGEWKASVHIVTGDPCRTSTLSTSLTRATNVSVSYAAEIVCVDGVDHLESIVLRRKRTREIGAMESGALFVFSRRAPRTSWLLPRVALDLDGFVLTDSRGGGGPSNGDGSHTSIPGIFAAGSVKRTWRDLTPFADAMTTAREVRRYLDEKGSER